MPLTAIRWDSAKEIGTTLSRIDVMVEAKW